MALVVASSGEEDVQPERVDTPVLLAMPAARDVRAWGKQYITDAMREWGFPARVAYAEAVYNVLGWIGLDKAPLLKAVWSAMEPDEGPEFRASFLAVFAVPFWPLVRQLEMQDADNMKQMLPRAP